MRKQNFEEWLTKFGNTWCAQDPDKTMELFSKDVEYYESVFEKPCANWDEVYNLWKVVPDNQKDVTYKFQLTSITEDLAVANWQVTRTLMPSNTKQNIDGIFVIKLNKKGLCNYFKQWRAVL